MKFLFKSSLISTLVLFVLGLLLVFESEATIVTISYVIGAILIAAGVFALIRFINNSKKDDDTIDISAVDILYGMVTMILGILIIKNPHAIASALPIVLGAIIIVSSANKIQYAVNLKKDGNNLWKTTIVLAIITTICGVVLLFNPFAGAVFIMRIIGLFIIIYSILDFVSTFIIKKNIDNFVNAYNDNNVIEAEVVKEAEVTSEKKTSKKKKKSSKPKKKKTDD